MHRFTLEEIERDTKNLDQLSTSFHSHWRRMTLAENQNLSSQAMSDLSKCLVDLRRHSRVAANLAVYNLHDDNTTEVRAREIFNTREDGVGDMLKKLSRNMLERVRRALLLASVQLHTLKAAPKQCALPVRRAVVLDMNHDIVDEVLAPTAKAPPPPPTPAAKEPPPPPTPSAKEPPPPPTPAAKAPPPPTTPTAKALRPRSTSATAPAIGLSQGATSFLAAKKEAEETAAAAAAAAKAKPVVSDEQSLTGDAQPKPAVVQPETLPVVVKSPVTQPLYIVHQLEVRTVTAEDDVGVGTLEPLPGGPSRGGKWETYGTMLCRDVFAGKRCRYEEKCHYAHSIEARDAKRRAFNELKK